MWRTWFGPESAPLRRRARALIALGVLTWGTAVSAPGAGRSGSGLLVTALVTVAAASWLCWLVRPDGRLDAAAVVVCGAAGVALTLVVPHSPALAWIWVAVVRAAYRWPLPAAAGYGAVLTAGYLVARIAAGDSMVWILGGPVVVAAAVGLGLLRRQNEELAGEAQSARDARARTAALDERARIAREIHDVLAHSLAALAVQLETADALLESGRPDQARLFVRQASQLSRAGMAETRRAVEALRGDTPPLPVLLDQLAAAYRADTRAPVTVAVDAPADALRPDVALTLFRTAQEAFTNVRKHAPGAPVDVRLGGRGADLRLSIVNGCAAAGPGPLAGTGGGHGLAGLRERAALAGGELTAGPAGDGWRVEVVVPG